MERNIFYLLQALLKKKKTTFCLNAESMPLLLLRNTEIFEIPQ